MERQRGEIWEERHTRDGWKETKKNRKRESTSAKKPGARERERKSVKA
jgi:hypothetical protein